MKFYKSIDELPIYYWNQIKETGDLSNLIVNYNGEQVTKYQQHQLKQIYEDLNKQFFDKFGKQDSYQEQIQELSQLYIWKIEGVLDNNPAAKIYARAEEKKMQSRETLNFDTTMAIIQRKLGFYVTAKQMTTTDYFTHIYLISKEGGNG